MFVLGAARTQAQSASLPARALAPVAVQSLCSELESWSAREAAAFTASARVGGANALRGYHEAFQSDSFVFALKGSGNATFFSRAALIDSLVRMSSELAADRFFAFRPLATSAALLSSTRAMNRPGIAGGSVR